MKRKKAVSGRKKSTRKPAIVLRAEAEGAAGESDANERFFRIYKPRKVAVTIRLDADVVVWFKQPGRKYQTRINQVLRRVMEEEAGR